jgi:hypothetical protein
VNEKDNSQIAPICPNCKTVGGVHMRADDAPLDPSDPVSPTAVFTTFVCSVLAPI